MIELKNVCKIYKDKKNKKIIALDNINLKLPDKGLVFIIGKSGNGKTTLLNNIGLLDNPTSGEIYIDNKKLNDLKNTEYDKYRNRCIGFIFQEYNLLSDLNVEQNIKLSLDLQNEKFIRNRVNKVLEDLDLSGLNKRKIKELSTGQKQRVAIARALIKNPRVILADEPTGALDEENSINFLSILKDISKDRLVIVVTHELQYLKEYSDRTIEIKKGKIIQDNIYNNDNYLLNKNVNLENNLKQKNKFSLKNIVKLGFLFLKKNKIKLTLSILLTAFSISCFSILSSINYDDLDNLLINAYKSESNNIIVNKSVTYGESIKNPNMQYKDIEYLNDNFSNNTFEPIYNITAMMFYFNKNIDYTNDYYHIDIDNFNYMVYDKEFMEQFNFKIVGKTPEKIDEVLITDYIFDFYKFMNYGDESFVDIEDYDDIINKTIIIENEKYKIVGIIDTNFNYEKYEILKDRKKSGLSNNEFKTLKNQYEINQVVGLHDYLFITREAFDSYLNSETTGKFFDSVFDIKSIENLNKSQQKRINNNFETISNDKLYWIGEKKDFLEGNEIFVPINFLIPYDEELGSLDSFKSNILNKSYDLIEEYTKTNHPKNLSSESYKSYIIHNKENEYEPEKKYEYFEEQAKLYLINNLYKDYFNLKLLNNNYSLNYSGIYEAKDLKIIGYYESNKTDDIFISKELYQEYIENNNTDIKYVMTKLTKNKNYDKKLFTFKTIEDRNDFQYVETNENLFLLNYIGGIFDYTIDKLIIIGSILLVFAIFVLANFVYSNVITRKKDIGILKSLGMKNKDIIFIYLVENLFIGLFSFFISLLTSISIVNYLNKSTKEKFLIDINFLFYDHKNILQLLFIIFITIFVIVVIPSIIITNKKPKYLLKEV